LTPLRDLVAALVLLSAGVASAQPTPPRSAAQEPTIGSAFGVKAAERLLSSANVDDRLRGVERLRAHGGRRALDALAKTLEPSGAARTPRERLLVVRALGVHAADETVRQALVRAMGGSGAIAHDDPLTELARRTAAMALAASGNAPASEALGRALRQSGSTAEYAAQALVAHPPRDLAPVLTARGGATVPLVRALGQLGDQRGFHALRAAVLRGTPDVRGHAAIALTQLGDLETVALAEQWLTRAGVPELWLAGATILTLTRAPTRAAALSRLLADERTVERALELAASAPHPGLVAALARTLNSSKREIAASSLAILGRIATDSAMAVLARALHTPLAPEAAFAVASAPGDAARSLVEKMLATRELRRFGVRAAAIRELTLGDTPRGLASAMARLLRSKEPADRAAAAWASSVLDADAARALLSSSDLAVVRAAARAAANPAVAAVAIVRLVRERDPATRTALAMALSDPSARAAISTHDLLQIAEDATSEPLAARALAARSDPHAAAAARALLRSTNSLTRAHVARGLGEGTRVEAPALLRELYSVESDPSVRQAVAFALGHVGRSTADQTTLRTMALLDPDDAVRTVARYALLSKPPRVSSRGPTAAWIQIRESDWPVPEGAALTIVTSTGDVLPAVPDPDGTLTLAGLPAGQIGLRLAPVSNRGEAARAR
jgi:HEAT repeat protein